MRQDVTISKVIKRLQTFAYSWGFWTNVVSFFRPKNSGTSKSSRMAKLLRHLILQSMSCNCLFRAKHVAGKHNSIADALSRNQVQRFRQLAPHANPYPVTISKELLLKLKN